MALAALSLFSPSSSSMPILDFSSFGAQRQCCNLQSVYIRSLQFIFSDIRLVVVERVRTPRQLTRNPLFSQTAGTRLYWCRRQSDLSHLTSTEEASAGSF